ncbi:MAG: C1 family peptidase [candidate division KSB1 bacterium]|nr:C1 family peptidase [candidate division KSB1 bacterium]
MHPGSDCQEGWYGSALKYAEVYGVVPEDCFRYDQDDDDDCGDNCTDPPWRAHVSGTDFFGRWAVSDGSTVVRLKNLIYDYGPAAVTMQIPEDGTFYAYSSGVYHHPGSAWAYTSHAVVAVGWDDQMGDHGAFRVRNSWGTRWGKDGYFWISYKDVTTNVQFGSYACKALTGRIKYENQNTAPQITDITVSDNPVSLYDDLDISVTAVDPDDQQIALQLDFGDGTPIGEYSRLQSSGSTWRFKYAYQTEGVFELRARARDETGLAGEWSNPVSAQVQKDRYIRLLYPVGGETLTAAAYYELQWESLLADQFNLYVSTDSLNWIEIDTEYDTLSGHADDRMPRPDLYTANWHVPQIDVEQGWIKVENAGDASHFDVSDYAFRIQDPGVRVELCMSDRIGLPGTMVYVDINMDNSYSDSAAVGDLFVILEQSNLKGFSIGAAETTSRSSGYSIQTEIDSLHILISLLSGNEHIMVSDTGSICRLPVLIAESAASGECSVLNVSAIMLYDESGDPLPVNRPDSARVCASPCRLCDADADGEISDLDISHIVNCVLKQDSCYDCADYNGDFSINVLDVVGCLNKMADSGRTSGQNAQDTVVVVPELYSADGKDYIRLTLSSGEDIQGCEFILTGDVTNLSAGTHSDSAAVRFYAAPSAEGLHVIGFTDIQRSELVHQKSIWVPVQGLETAGSLYLDGLVLADVEARSIACTLEVNQPVWPTGMNRQEQEKSVILSNYPNPANPGTHIQYSLNELSNIKLVIYNSTGQVVRLLDSGVKMPGTHKVYWDTRNNTGQPVANGVYFYTLIKDAKRITRKLIVLQ